MNSSKTNSILQNIENNTSSIDTNATTKLTEIDTVLDNSYTLQVTMNSKLNENTSYTEGCRDTLDLIQLDTSSIDSTINSNQSILTNNGTRLYNIEQDLTTINDTLVDIGVSLNKTLTPKKVIFNGYLTDGNNEYLPRANYEGSPFIFYWQNPYDKPVYIHRYNFRYQEANESATLTELYHSPDFVTKIGLVNDDDTDFDNNYITFKSNVEMIDFTGSIKRSYTTTNFYVYDYIFPENHGAPLEIGVSKKFGHYIAGDFQSSQGYDNDPIGQVYGYYYE